MIEQGIYFALGCIVTALCALMFAPVFWRRALRLTRKRLQLQIPLSMQEIYAERDQLRAEFAVERVQLEQDLERVHAGKAADMADLGRRSMDLTRSFEALTKAKRAEETLRTELQEAQHQLVERNAQLSALRSELDDALAQRTETVAPPADSGAPEGPLLEGDTHIHRLEAEKATLQSALDEARRNIAGASAIENSGLRESIHELGVAVAAMDAGRFADQKAEDLSAAQ